MHGSILGLVIALRSTLCSLLCLFFFSLKTLGGNVLKSSSQLLCSPWSKPGLLCEGDDGTFTPTEHCAEAVSYLPLTDGWGGHYLHR